MKLQKSIKKSLSALLEWTASQGFPGSLEGSRGQVLMQRRMGQAEKADCAIPRKQEHIPWVAGLK